MPRSLPASPSFDQLRKQAKDLHKTCEEGVPDALARVQASHPAYAGVSEAAVRSADLSLRDAQLVVAREYNFDDWARLKEYFEWDLVVRAQDVDRMLERLEEKPERAQQLVMQFRRDASYWTMGTTHFANNNIPMLKLLLSYGAGMGLVLGPGSQPEYIDFVLAQGEDIDKTYYNGTPLSLAAYTGNVASVQHYILRGANINYRAEGSGVDRQTGETPLHRAAFTYRTDQRGDYTEIVRLLIAAGANVNAQTNVDVRSEMGRNYHNRGEIPLHLACAYGEEAMIRMFMEAGADKTAENALGETPMDFAVKHERSEDVLALLR